jgi:hypothetical protein
MSFTVYTHDGMKETHWFTIDQLIKSMLANPKNTYHRNS